MKGVSVIIAAIIVIIISLTAIFLALQLGNPGIDRAKEILLMQEGKNTLTSIDNAVKSVSEEGQGSTRVLKISVTGGYYLIDTNEEAVIFSMDSFSQIIAVGVSKTEDGINMMGEPSKVSLNLSYGNFNVTGGGGFGRGTHTLIIRNDGYDVVNQKQIVYISLFAPLSPGTYFDPYNQSQTFVFEGKLLAGSTSNLNDLGINTYDIKDILIGGEYPYYQFSTKNITGFNTTSADYTNSLDGANYNVTSTIGQVGGTTINLYNQSGFPYIVSGTNIGGSPNNLNILGEGATYDVEEEGTGQSVSSIYYEGVTQLINGTVYSGSTANLDVDDNNYYQVDADYSSVGGATNNTATGENDEDDWISGESSAGDVYSGSLSYTYTSNEAKYDLIEIIATGGNPRNRNYLLAWRFDFTGLDTSRTDTKLFLEAQTTGEHFRVYWGPDTLTHNQLLACTVTTIGDTWYSCDIPDDTSSTIYIYIKDNNDDRADRTDRNIADHIRIDTMFVETIVSGVAISVLNITHNSSIISEPINSIRQLNITLKFESNVTETYYFDIFNWTDSQWYRMRTGSIGTTEVTWNWINDSAVSNFIEATNKVVKVRLRADSTSPFRSLEDLLEFNVSYITYNYRAEVWHNSTQINYPGTLNSINATINFTTNVSDFYALEIYNWTGSSWYICSGGGSIPANTPTRLWCNMTTNPMYYNSSDRIVRIRISSFSDSDVGLLKEDYIQYYVGYTTGPTYANISVEHNSSTISENPALIESINVTTLLKTNVSAGINFTFYIYNFNTPGWEQCSQKTVYTTYTQMECYKATNPSYYFNNDIIRVRLNSSGDITTHQIMEDYLVYQITLPSNYRMGVEHNATGVIWSGNLDNINVSVNFSTNLTSTFSLIIYDFNSGSWDTSCDNGSPTENIWNMWWCNITTLPENYISSDNKIRIRLNNTAHSNPAKIKEDYVQYYVTYTT